MFREKQRERERDTKRKTVIKFSARWKIRVSFATRHGHVVVRSQKKKQKKKEHEGRKETTVSIAENYFLALSRPRSLMLITARFISVADRGFTSNVWIM